MASLPALKRESKRAQVVHLAVNQFAQSTFPSYDASLVKVFDYTLQLHFCIPARHYTIIYNDAVDSPSPIIFTRSRALNRIRDRAEKFTNHSDKLRTLLQTALYRTCFIRRSAGIMGKSGDLNQYHGTTTADTKNDQTRHNTITRR